MALINMAYCHSQLGDGKESIRLYEKALEKFPDSEMAKSALRIFESAKEISARTGMENGQGQNAPSA